MTAYYNEIDPNAAEWLRQLIKAGAIAPGDVDERDIRDVAPVELKPYSQCHFFAGIGAWSYALRQSGWPDDRPVWTGSAPCQPFSTAGQRAGVADERHLWPAMFWLVQQCCPPVMFCVCLLGSGVRSPYESKAYQQSKPSRVWTCIVQCDRPTSRKPISSRSRISGNHSSAVRSPYNSKAFQQRLTRFISESIPPVRSPYNSKAFQQR